MDDKQVIVEVPDVQVYGEIAVVGRVDKEESNKLRFNNKKKEEEEDPDRVFDSQGHEIHPQSLELTFLKRTGPFTLLQDGNIFTVAEGGSTASISMDKGMNWDTYSLFDPTRFSALSPVVIQTKKGTIIVGFSNGREISPLNWNKTTHTYNVNAKLPTYIIYSTDNGKKWSNPIKLHDDWTGMNRDIMETKDGNIVFATMKMRNNLGRHCVLTYVSKDDGRSWTPSNVLDEPTCAGDHSGLMESTLVQLHDGRLWMLLRTNWDYFYETYSSDDGLTWSEHTKTAIDASSSPGALERLASGRLVLVWDRLYHEEKTSIGRLGGDKNLSEVQASWQRDELSMMYSDDDGETWSAPFILAKNIEFLTNPWDTKKWLSYPFIFEVSPGELWITTGHGNLKIAIKEVDIVAKE